MGRGRKGVRRRRGVSQRAEGRLQRADKKKTEWRLVGKWRSNSWRAGFTILEILIALSIVIAIGALAMPSLWGLSSSVRMREAGRIVTDAVAEARTEAQKRGVAIRMQTKTTAEGRTVLVGEAASVRTALEDLRQDATTDDGGASSEKRVPALVWAELPEGCTLAREMDEAGEEGAGGLELSAEQKAGLPRWLWVVLPDGAVSSEGSSTLKGPGDRRASVVVNKWTGLVRVREEVGKDAGTRTADGAKVDEESGG